MNFTILFADHLTDILRATSIGVLIIFTLVLFALLFTHRMSRRVHAALVSAAFAMIALLMIFQIAIPQGGMNPNRSVGINSTDIFGDKSVKNPQNITEASDPGLTESDRPSKFGANFKLAVLITVIYIFGVLVMAVRLLIGLLVSKSRLARADKIENGEIYELTQSIKHSLQVKVVVPVLVIDQLSAPYVTGLIRPVLVIPRWLNDKLDPQQIGYILAHELAHLKRYDHLIIILQRIVEVALFFHPAIWILSRMLNQYREEACDDMVVELSASPAKYAETLLSLSLSEPPVSDTLALGVANRKSLLGNRIRRLVGIEAPSQVGATSILPLLLIVAAFIGTFALQSKSQAEPLLNAQQALEAGKRAAQERWQVDAKHFTKEELKKIEAEYQRIHQMPHDSDEFRSAVDVFLTNYPTTNRAGCLALDRARNYERSARIKALKYAVKHYGNCRFGDGVQVAAMGRLYQAEEAFAAQDTDTAKKLCAEIRANHPNSVDHGQKLLRERITVLSNRPAVVQTVPKNGDQGVPFDLHEIRVTFDRPMSKGGFSFVGGGPLFPTTGEPKWIDEYTIVLPVELEADHSYQLSINSQSYRNFRSLDGAPAEPFPINFKTLSKLQANQNGIERLNQLNYYDAARDEARSKFLKQIAEGWSSSSEILRMEAKLASIVIPNIDFENTPLEDVLMFLQEKSAELDVEETNPKLKGVNIIMMSESTMTQALPTITIRMKNVPLGAALKNISVLAKQKYQVESHAVVVSPISPPDSTLLFTQIYKVPHAFLNGASPKTAKQALENAGISFGAGSTAYYNLKTSTLIVKNNPAQMKLVDAYLESIMRMASSAVDSLNYLGMSFETMIAKLGQPKSVSGPAEGMQTWEYNEGISLVIQNEKVVHYIIKAGANYQTDKGINVGDPISKVTKAYGEPTETIVVEKWFAGNRQQVLYHHQKNNYYKINYANHDVIFWFDRDKKVESIRVGYIYPVEK